jgi:hypothetical protein
MPPCAKAVEQKSNVAAATTVRPVFMFPLWVESVLLETESQSERVKHENRHVACLESAPS